MTSLSDITLLLTTDGEPWGQYLTSRLDEFPEVKHSCVTLDDQTYENPPEVTRACCTSALLLLLATPEFLTYMSDKAGWFSKILNNLPVTSAVVVVLLVDKKEFDAAVGNFYNTSAWKFEQPGGSASDVLSMVVNILDAVDECLKKKEAYLTPTPPVKKHTVSVDLFPSKVYQAGTVVAMVFAQEIKGELTAKLGQSKITLQLTRINPYVYSFPTPEISPGTYPVLIYQNGKRLKRIELKYCQIEEVVLTSPQYMCQCLSVPDLHSLDLKLKDIFISSVPGDRGLETVFRHIPEIDQSELHKKADCLYPTLLHYAAAHGLSEFCSTLLDCPGSERAFHIRNCNGHDPADVAKENGHLYLEDYIIDFIEMQEASKIYDEYVTMATSSQESLYDDVGDLLSKPAGKPPLPPRNQDPGPQHLTPPAPPPRNRSSEVPQTRSLSTSSIPSVDDKTKHMSLPRTMTPLSSKTREAADFIGLGANSIATTLPRAAMGSRTQADLIEWNEMVKSGELTISEAESLFRAWQERYGRNTAASFKERQNQLQKIKDQYMELRKAQNVKTERGVLSWIRGIKSKQESIKLNISEPTPQRQYSAKTPLFLNKSASCNSFLGDRTSSASSSSSSSRDSGWSLGSRESAMSTVTGLEEEGTDDEALPDSEVVERRHPSTSSMKNRKSLGAEYFQRVSNNQNLQGTLPAVPPRLPPRRK